MAKKIENNNENSVVDRIFVCTSKSECGTFSPRITVVLKDSVIGYHEKQCSSLHKTAAELNNPHILSILKVKTSEKKSLISHLNKEIKDCEANLEPLKNNPDNYILKSFFAYTEDILIAEAPKYLTNLHSKGQISLEIANEIMNLLGMNSFFDYPENSF